MPVAAGVRPLRAEIPILYKLWYKYYKLLVEVRLNNIESSINITLERGEILVVYIKINLASLNSWYRHIDA